MDWDAVPGPSWIGGQPVGQCHRPTSVSNARAVGYYIGSTSREHTIAERWNGSAWKSVRTPDPGGTSSSDALSGVAANPTDNVTAVGGTLPR
jgi:hypothetical protein